MYIQVIYNYIHTYTLSKILLYISHFQAITEAKLIGLKLETLPREQFPVGKTFYSKYIEGKWDLAKTVLVHNNYVRGDKKIARFKQFKQWVL